MTCSLAAIAGFAIRRRRAVLLGWLLAAVALVTVGHFAGQSSPDRISVPGSDSDRAAAVGMAAFPDSDLPVGVLVVHSSGAPLTSRPLAAALQQTVALAGDVPHHGTVSSPLDTARGRGGAMLSPDRRTAAISVQPDSPSEATLARLDAALAPVRAAGARAEVGGSLAVGLHRPGTGTSEKLGFAIVLVVLLLVFGSLVSALVPLATACAALGVGLPALQLLGRVMPVPSSAPALAGMIGLGVAVDYALFVLTRHRAERAAGRAVEDSVAVAMSSAGRAVVFAGGCVAVAISALALTGIPFVMALGLAAALVVVIAVAAALTLLPALLAVLGDRVDAIGVPLISRFDGRENHRRGWHRWAGLVTRRPWPALAASLATLGALTWPVLNLHLGSVDASTLARREPARWASDTLGRALGSGVAAPLRVVFELPRTAGTGVLAAARHALAGIPGIVSVSAPVRSASGTVATMSVVPAHGGHDPATIALVRHLRDGVLPSLAGIGHAHVSGAAAAALDLATRVQDRLPIVIGAVVVATVVLLGAVFRSVLVPVKAAVMNLLSIGAAYGVVTVVVQEGHGAHLIGLDGPHPVPAFVPIFMFSILFGLSMDYEVFLLSRIREAYLVSGDTNDAVARGLGSTARVITSAAAIMVAAFAAFMLGSDPVVKTMGLGLAVAVLVDATVVRIALVPAAMALMGRANWWLPAVLDRILPRLHGEPMAPVTVLIPAQRTADDVPVRAAS